MSKGYKLTIHRKANPRGQKHERKLKFMSNQEREVKILVKYDFI